MGGGGVGGDTSSVHDGGAQLTSLGTAMSHRATDVDGACTSAKGAVGEGTVEAALARFAAAAATTCTDLGTQLTAGGQLATNASADLASAGGVR